MSKKVIISLIFSSLILPACNKQNNLMPNQNLIKSQTEVKAQSNKGLKSYYSFVINNSFSSNDKNNDGYIELEELSQNTTNISRFTAIDRNRDGKLSKKEVERKPSIFLGQSRKQLRNYHQMSFQSLDLNFDKKITPNELSKSYLDNNSIIRLMIGDKNNDRKLSFSEYEDVSYSIQMSYFENPPEPVSPEPPLYDSPNDDYGYGDGGDYGSCYNCPET